MPEGMETKLIAIDGCGGSGKSTLAARLADEISGAYLLHTDDFASWDVPLEWWPRLVEQVIEPLTRNQPARYQRYDWGTRKLADWHDVPVGGVVIIEGVSALRREFRRAISYGIFVQTPRALRLDRGLERDGQDAVAQWQEWMAQEDAYLSDHKPEEHADLLIDGTKPY